MLNIVIPMAGLGSRFSAAGYELPKPLIHVHDVPMIKVVIDNLTPKEPHRFIFICQNTHLEKYQLAKTLKSFTPNAEVIGIDEVTQGQVCTVLKAEKFIDKSEPIMTANSDQFIDFDINEYLDHMRSQNLDGLIMTMKSTDPKWSYVKTNSDGYAIETAEKKVISNDATVGIYNFKSGNDLVRAAHKMIKNNIKVNNEFYTCPCYNYIIEEGKKIGVYSIGEEYNGMYGLGIPKDLDFFMNHQLSKKFKVSQ